MPDFLSAKSRGVRLTMLTAYDYTMARLLDAAGVDGLLVGDSLGMVVQGNETSLAVTLDEMIYHTRLVARGVRRSLLVADMPFMSYQVSPQQALENAGRLVKEGGAHAVKLEGGVRSAAAIEAITRCDIPVMGHVGLTPQSVRRFGGFRVQRDEKRILEDALATQAGRRFALVLECVPAELAHAVTAALSIPTIGIGAGPAATARCSSSTTCSACSTSSGRASSSSTPTSARPSSAPPRRTAARSRDGSFPGPEHSFR